MPRVYCERLPGGPTPALQPLRASARPASTHIRRPYNSGMQPSNELARRGPATRRAASKRRRRRSGLTTAIGVAGDLLITAGVLVLCFLGWQLYANNLIEGGQQQAEANQLGQAWAQSRPDLGKEVGTVPKPGQPTTTAQVAVYSGAPQHGERFAALIIPRFGADWQRTVAEGTDTGVLSRFGIGHYEGTALPGALGNFAIASHRDIDGAAFQNIDQLDVGDSIYLQTADGWYRYVYRSHTVVKPTAVDAVAPVPFDAGATPEARYLTMTTCSPKWTSTERLIAYAVFDSFTPTVDGPPAEISGIYAQGGNA